MTYFEYIRSISLDVFFKMILNILKLKYLFSQTQFFKNIIYLPLLAVSVQWERKFFKYYIT